MLASLQLNGVYSLSMAQLAESAGFSAISLDYRPKELSFIQHYKALEILSYFEKKTIQIVIQFGEEKSEMVDIFLKEILSLYPDLKSHLKIEFSGPWRDVESFLIPYSWRGLNSFDAKTNLLIGHVISLKDFLSLNESFSKPKFGRNNKFKLDVELDSSEISEEALRQAFNVNGNVVLFSSRYSPQFRTFDEESFIKDIHYLKELTNENTAHQ